MITNKENKSKNWLYSIAINLAILIVNLAFTEVMYETNDDFAISQMISGGYPYVRFVNYFLCQVLIFIQSIFPEINIFMLSQIVMGFLSFTVIVKVILDRRYNNIEIVLTTMLVALFSFDHYSSIQFTKTAAILMTAGLIWAVDNYTHERSISVFIAAFLLYYVGVAFRENGMLPAIGYAGVYVLIWWIYNREKVFSNNRLPKEAGLFALILVILFIPYGIDAASDAINESTPELKYSRDYSKERAGITDFPLMDFEGSKEKYDAIGISENDIYLIDRFVFDYEGGATLENMRAINAINRPHAKDAMNLSRAVKKTLREAFQSMVDKSFSGMHIMIALALAIYIMIVNRPRTLWYVLMFGALSAAVYISIYYMQRPQYRALYLGDIGAVFWLLYASVVGEKIGKSARVKGGAAILSVAIMLIIWPAKEMLDYIVVHNNNSIESQDILEYYDEHPNQFFVTTTTTMGMPVSYKDPLSKPIAPLNASDTGGWETLTPYKLECLAKSGVYNPVKELIDNPNMILVGDHLISELKEYYNKWYCNENEYIDFVRVGKAGETNLYNVVKMQK